VDEGRDEHLGDDVVELVLGTVDGDRRAAMAAHVLRCAACRHEYDELAATVEDLLPAVPGAQPPLGFDERVLARMAAIRSPASARTNRRRWTWVAVAAAALVALLVPLGIWAASRDDGASSTGDVATLRLSRDGTAVGSVSLSDIDGTPVMVVALVGAPDDVSYYCRINFADGTSSDSESWPSGNGAWVVPLDPAGPTVASVDVLPDGTEKVWSAASFT
jgi:anti-sigma factor RsiW